MGHPIKDAEESMGANARTGAVGKAEQLLHHLMETVKVAGSDAAESDHWAAVADLPMDAGALEAKAETQA